jgi:hypothetical protein
MSDEDEVIYVKRQKTIHYGSLEETMENRMKMMRTEVESSAPTIQSNSQVPEYFDIDEEV